MHTVPNQPRTLDSAIVRRRTNCTSFVHGLEQCERGTSDPPIVENVGWEHNILEVQLTYITAGSEFLEYELSTLGSTVLIMRMTSLCTK